MVELNKRILLNNSKGVVKYYGELEVTNGFWVGVDWDDKYRGKHDGSYKGKKYFKAFSNTSGSFLRENDLDFGTDLLDEINEKYASDLKMDEIKIKDSPDAKLFEFVKMEKTFQKQKQIFQLKVLFGYGGKFLQVFSASNNIYFQHFFLYNVYYFLPKATLEENHAFLLHLSMGTGTSFLRYNVHCFGCRLITYSKDRRFIKNIRIFYN
ncbi:CAP-Gly domain-containing protein [Meloidogyne graminicola]|uniref:CAP-Gly domain-containing protein n=1 Tax=Meloidogyne graminicola TaxID=189291 RepID=A0A8S9ZVJ1_9BILA|nr:CAP-Gly domain-containing protein [Meloidogyne graminicola]